MDLAFGTNVREHGYTIGRLIGIEVDRRTRAVRNILISATGTVDSHVERRPLVDIPAGHFDGDIVLCGFPAAGETLAPHETLVLTNSTRVMRGAHSLGRLLGVELSAATGEIVALVGRQHWWSRRFHLPAAALDFSVLGEVRVGTATSQAA